MVFYIDVRGDVGLPVLAMLGRNSKEMERVSLLAKF